MDIKITAERKIENIGNIISFINSQINEVHYKQNIPLAYIRVSIPFWFQQILDYYYNENIGHSGTPNFRRIFNCEVVDGYNNQICVFNSRAFPEQEFLVFKIEHTPKSEKTSD